MYKRQHYSRVSDLIRPDHLISIPSVPVSSYRDGFGNWCTRLVAPQGRLRLSADALLQDTGIPEPTSHQAWQHEVQQLPEETLVFLLGSRYCETDRLSELAWNLFEKSAPGWARVQAICDFVHNYLAFGYQHASSTKTCLLYTSRCV